MGSKHKQLTFRNGQPQTGIEFLRRHMSQDGGELSDKDVRENWLSVKEEGFRLLSAHRTAKG
jgi:hypothetical protein